MCAPILLITHPRYKVIVDILNAFHIKIMNKPVDDTKIYKYSRKAFGLLEITILHDKYLIPLY